MHSAPVRPVVRRIKSSISIASAWRRANSIHDSRWWPIESIMVPSMSKISARMGPTPEAASPLPLKGATPADGRSPIRGVCLGMLIQTPCFRLAEMKASRSPSSTFCVLLISTLVRRSLMRLWSST